jgi:hypothetical protein
MKFYECPKDRNVKIVSTGEYVHYKYTEGLRAICVIPVGIFREEEYEFPADWEIILDT